MTNQPLTKRQRDEYLKLLVAKRRQHELKIVQLKRIIGDTQDEIDKHSLELDLIDHSIGWL